MDIIRKIEKNGPAAFICGSESKNRFVIATFEFEFIPKK